MYYSVSDINGKWTLLRGWHGCQAGQGSVVFTDLEEWQLNQIYEALVGRNFQNENIEKLEAELKVSEELLEDREDLLEAIPQCPVHGKCMPHAIEWIEEAKNLAKIVGE